MHAQDRAYARRADVLPRDEERDGPEPERLEHADLERRPAHPKGVPARTESGRGSGGDRLSHH